MPTREFNFASATINVGIRTGTADPLDLTQQGLAFRCRQVLTGIVRKTARLHHHRWVTTTFLSIVIYQQSVTHDNSPAICEITGGGGSGPASGSLGHVLILTFSDM